MKKAIIIIRPNMYQQTKEALDKAGFSAISSINVHGRGKKAVHFTSAGTDEEETYVGYHRFMAKKMIMMYIRDTDEERLVRAVIDINQTQNSGDGKIFIIPVKDGIRIRTGESKDEAIV